MPHREEATEFTPEKYPPFPDSDDLALINLETISLRKIQNADETEQTRMFEACKGWGFFFLDLSDSEQGKVILDGANELCRVAEQAFKLPLEEKVQYRFGIKEFFGYKKVGYTLVDQNKTPDTSEYWNIGKDDMATTEIGKMRCKWPDVILQSQAELQRYQSTAHSICLQILTILAEKLDIDPDEIHRRHRFEHRSGDHIRLTRGPPRKTSALPEIQTPSHTDFGSITLLMNWLGGLQLYGSPNRQRGNLAYASEDDKWLWVKPKNDCAIINLGDAMVEFTNRALCSGRHRVVPAPGEQGKWPRYSVVYFVRPTDGSKLRPLFRRPNDPSSADSQDEEEGIEMKEWIFLQGERLRKGEGEAY